MNPTKYYWIALLALLAVHSAVAFGGYRLLTWRTRSTPDSGMVTATAKEVRQSEAAKYGVTAFHVPWPLILYVALGYGALIAAALIGFLSWTRHHEGFGL